MKKIFVFFAFILLSKMEVVKAQDRVDHLEPVISVFELSDFSFDYNTKIRKILFKGLSKKPEIRFLEKPSFTAESVLEIERMQGKYFLIYQICEENIWYSKNWEGIKVQTFKTEIDKASVDLIKTLFDVAISQVRFPPAPIPKQIVNADGTVFESVTLSINTDGTNYFFTTNQYGKIKTGVIWSPASGTKMGQLVNIGYGLVELAKAKNELVFLDEDLKRKIEQLISEMNE